MYKTHTILYLLTPTALGRTFTEDVINLSPLSEPLSFIILYLKVPLKH